MFDRGAIVISTMTTPPDILPWHSDTTPLMLAPMQGLTNRGLRNLFACWVRPDSLFTEFMRVAPGETTKDRKSVV